MPKTISFILILILILPQSSSYSTKLYWSEENNTIYGNGIIVTFHNSKPDYWVRIPNSTDNISYIIRFLRLFEFIDSNENNLYDEDDQVISSTDLLSATWNISYENITMPKDNTTELVGILVYLRSNASVYNQNTNQTNNTLLSFSNHLFSFDTYIESYPVIGNREIKIDFSVAKWPWTSNRSMLCLEISFLYLINDTFFVPTCHFDTVTFENLELNRVTIRASKQDYIEFRFSRYVRFHAINITQQDIYVSYNFTNSPAILRITFPYSNGTLVYDSSILAMHIEQPPQSSHGLHPIFVIIPIAVGTTIIILYIREEKKRER